MGKITKAETTAMSHICNDLESAARVLRDIRDGEFVPPPPPPPLMQRPEDTAEIKRLSGLIAEVISGDWTDATHVLELPSRLAESGWFKRAHQALGY